MKSLSRVAWAGLVALNTFFSAPDAIAADSGPSPDPVAFYCGSLSGGDSDLFDNATGQAVGSPSGVFSLDKGAMTPSGNPLLTAVPGVFTWTREVGGVTRYLLKLSLLNKNTGLYGVVCKSWIPQPANGNPTWKPPVHAIITGGQYRWAITAYVGLAPRTTSVAYFMMSTQKRAYMVIDLSGGPSALSYPVTYLNAVPPGGWTYEYKTSKLVMRLIPGGTFTMGSPANELGRASGEAMHQVTLTKSFYVGVFEVTQRQWELVLGNRPSYFNNSLYYASRPVEQVSYYDIRENPNNSAISPNWPQSSQVHANSFMGKLRSKTGLSTVDLPTEAQWEYACRAGTTTALNSGKNLTDRETCPNLSEVGRYARNHDSFDQGAAPSVGGTATAGSYNPNAWGLYDMHGNVWEWCLDWYGALPGTVSDPKGALSGTIRMTRGGCCFHIAWICRSANRGLYTPLDQYGSHGFRLARTLP